MALIIIIIVISVIFGANLLFINFFGNKLQLNNQEKIKDINEEYEKKLEQEEYDVSDFKIITLEKYTNIFKEDKINFVYMGRESCNSCKSFVPKLNKLQEEYDFDIYYIESDKIDYNSDYYKNFIELDPLIKQNVGGVPMNIISKNGKAEYVISGSILETELKNILKEYEVIK